MRVRLASLTDLSAIVAFGKRHAARTNYAPLGYNAVTARRTAKAYMTNKDCRVWVTVDERNRIRGLLVAELGPMPFTAYMAATDLVFAAEQGGRELLAAFVAWCKMRGVARIDMGVSAGPEHEAALRELFAEAGFAYSGPMFHRNLIAEADAVGVRAGRVA